MPSSVVNELYNLNLNLFIRKVQYIKWIHCSLTYKDKLNGLAKILIDTYHVTKPLKKSSLVIQF